jgi:hypothetical protein
MEDTSTLCSRWRIISSPLFRPMTVFGFELRSLVVDGKEAATFLIRAKDCIEKPRAPSVGNLNARSDESRRIVVAAIVTVNS